MSLLLPLLRAIPNLSPVISVIRTLFLLLLAVLAVRLAQWIYTVRASPINALRGPARVWTIPGHFKTIFEPDRIEEIRVWLREYGDTVRIQGPFGVPMLFTTDQRVAHHVYTHTNLYHKAPTARNRLRMIADGILFAEGAQHAQQRRIMNPTFGTAQIKEFVPLFLAKSIQMRDLLLDRLARDQVEASASGKGEHADEVRGEGDGKEVETHKDNAVGRKRYNVTEWLSKATLDVIGLAGFNYDFGSLTPSEPSIDPETGEPRPRQRNELSAALSVVLNAGNRGNGLRQVMVGQFPFLRKVLPSTEHTRNVQTALDTMNRIGMELINAKKRAVVEASEKGAGADAVDGLEGGNGLNGKTSVKADDVRGKDLLSLMIKANMAGDLPEEKRMSDHDVLFQVPTFILAGHETSATASTWALFALATHPDIQTRLRQELLSVGTDEPTADALDRLPYLDAVVREALRLHPPVPLTTRCAMEADVVPLSTPIVGKDGVERREVKVRKGDHVIFPILVTNRDKAIWGEDADEFNPDRWSNVPEKAKEIAGVWGNMASFGAGTRACIGFRFALFEVKVLLFTLLRTFTFDPAFQLDDLRSSGLVVRRPFLASEAEKGNQMPLYLTPVKT